MDEKAKGDAAHGDVRKTPVGQGLRSAERANDRAMGQAFAHHKSYGQELGDEMAKHAKGVGRKIPSADHGRPADNSS